jgi:type 1 glutamine amidotransferase
MDFSLESAARTQQAPARQPGWRFVNRRFIAQIARYAQAASRLLLLLLGLVVISSAAVGLSKLFFGLQTGPVPTGHSAEVVRSAMQPSQFSVLVFTKTAGFRHSSIPDGITALTTLGQTQGFLVNATEDAAVFTDDQLAAHRVVVFLSTSGDVLDADQQAAFERFIQSGGGFVGIHSATDTEYGWPWYGQLVGAYFANHPAIQTATVQVLDKAHLSMLHLPERWTRVDEWYNFQALPAPTVTVLAEVDESTYTGGTMGAHHPLVWCHEYDGGRAWYTALGHTEESYADELFRGHLAGGILWAAGIELSNRVYLPLLVH